MAMIKNILVFLILFSFTSIIQASEPNARQEHPSDIDFRHYKSQRNSISFADHNTFGSMIQSLENKDITTIDSEIKEKSNIIIQSIRKEKESLLDRFKNEFNIPDDKWNTYIDLVNALHKNNNNNKLVSLESSYDSAISHEHLAVITSELVNFEIDPARINIYRAHATQQPTFHCPHQHFTINDNDDNYEITILPTGAPGTIVLPTYYDSKDPLFVLFCRISACAIANNDALAWEIMPALFSFFNITEPKSYYESTSYKQAIPSFTSHPILSLAFSGPTDAEFLERYLKNNYIPQVSLRHFAWLSKIKIYWDIFTWATKKEQHIKQTQHQNDIMLFLSTSDLPSDAHT
jgi:hypothetical protein